VRRWLDCVEINRLVSTQYYFRGFIVEENLCSISCIAFIDSSFTAELRITTTTTIIIIIINAFVTLHKVVTSEASNVLTTWQNVINKTWSSVCILLPCSLHSVSKTTECASYTVVAGTFQVIIYCMIQTVYLVLFTERTRNVAVISFTLHCYCYFLHIFWHVLLTLL